MVNEISRSKYRLENAMESSGFGTRDRQQIGLAVGSKESTWRMWPGRGYRSRAVGMVGVGV